MRGRRWLATVAPAAALVPAGCTPLARDVHRLASDAMGGRDNDTEGSALARDYIIDRIDDFAMGLDPSRPGAEAFTQRFAGGTNILALIPGAVLSDEYVIIGAHYDHIGTSCASADPADDIGNGATDNATGAAAVLSIGETLAQQRGGPDRSVILALWDREEDGLLGARHYLASPLVPVERPWRTSTSTSRGPTFCRACARPPSPSAPRPVAIRWWRQSNKRSSGVRSTPTD